MFNQMIKLFGLVFGLVCIVFHKHWGNKLVDHFAKTAFRQYSEAEMIKEKRRASRLYLYGGMIFTSYILWKALS